MAIDTTDVAARSKKAWSDKTAIQWLIDEAYEYALPYRKPVNGVTNNAAPGEARVDRVFDNTAIVSSFRFAGRLQNDLVPPAQKWFTLDLGPISKLVAAGLAPTDGDQLKQLRETLQGDAEVVNALFQGGEFDTAVHEMFLDLAAGTGAMMIVPGDDERPVRFVTAPIDDIALEPGPYNDVGGIFYKRKWSARVLPAMWPKAEFPADIAKLIRTKPDDEITVCQDATFDYQSKRWSLTAYRDTDKKGWHKVESRACPWVTPRYYKLAGESYGRGPIHVTLPTIKTLNKAQELALKGAAMAILGIYTRIDDGVFNPKTSRIAPGAMWTVARNGGLLGPSIQKLDTPGRYDLSQLVLQELRMQVKEGLLDQQLPPDGATPRSASEIMERVKRLALEHNGALGRLVQEFVVPAVKRVMEIAADRGLLQSKMRIDQLLVAVVVTSPLAIALRAQQAKVMVDYLTLLISVLAQGGQQTAGEIVQLYAMLEEIGRMLGIEEKWFRGEAGRRDIEGMVNQRVQQAIAGALQMQQQQEQLAAAAAPAA